MCRTARNHRAFTMKAGVRVKENGAWGRGRMGEGENGEQRGGSDPDVDEGAQNLHRYPHLSALRPRRREALVRPASGSDL